MTGVPARLSTTLAGEVVVREVGVIGEKCCLPLPGVVGEKCCLPLPGVIGEKNVELLVEVGEGVAS